MYLEELKNRGLLLIGTLKPGKCLFVLAESQISVYKGSSGNVTLPLPSLQFINKVERFGASAGEGEICRDD